MNSPPDSAPRPDPAWLRSFDALAQYLRQLRAWNGNMSYAALTRRVNKARGAADAVGQTTVYECFRLGRARVDADLVVDIAATLGLDDSGQTQLRRVVGEISGDVAASYPVDVRDAIPESTETFVGRESELGAIAAALRDAADSRVAPAVSIVGPAGAGKTETAIAAAHRLLHAGRCADLQLYVDLRGFDVEQPPAEPNTVLAAILQLLGVGDDLIHLRATAAKRRELLRSQLTDKKTLLLLDNAADDEQLAALLPDSPNCVTLTTSRQRIAVGVEEPITLGPLPSGDAVELLRRHDRLGRVDADPGTADTLASDWCAGMPLELRALAGRLSDPDEAEWSLSDHLARLEQFPRDEFIRPALAASYARLEPTLQRSFRLLTLHPGSDFTAYDLAALADLALPEAETQAQQLRDRHLLAQRGDGRLRFHDAVRAFAARMRHRHDPASRQDAATDRLERYYCAATAEAIVAFAPYLKNQRMPTLPACTTARPEFSAQPESMAWLHAEYNNLLASAERSAAQGRGSRTVALARLLSVFLNTVGYPRRSERLLKLSLRHGEVRDRIQNHFGLGTVYRQLAQSSSAVRHCRQALKLSKESNDDTYTGSILGTLGAIYSDTGRIKEARSCISEAIKQFRESGACGHEAMAFNNLGNIYRLSGEYARSLEVLEQSLDLARRSDNRDVEVCALSNLGQTLNITGRHEEAIGLQLEANRVHREIGHASDACFVMVYLGHAQVRAGLIAAAANTFQDTLETAEGLGQPSLTAEVLNGLGVAWHGLGETAAALELQERALTVSLEKQNTFLESEVRNRLGCALSDLGRAAEAVNEHRRARELSNQTGYRYQRAHANDGLGGALSALGEAEEAAECWRQAAAEFHAIGVPEAATVDAKLAALPRR